MTHPNEIACPSCNAPPDAACNTTRIHESGPMNGVHVDDVVVPYMGVEGTHVRRIVDSQVAPAKMVGPDRHPDAPWWEVLNARCWGPMPDWFTVEKDSQPLANWLAVRGQRPHFVVDAADAETTGGVYLFIVPIISAHRALGNHYSIADRDGAHRDLSLWIDGYRAGQTSGLGRLLADRKASTRVDGG